jgi:CMP-N-acetylneuraminic acid synthetase
LAIKYNCQFILRKDNLCNNDTPLPILIREVTNQIPYEDEIAWCQVTDPLFEDYVGVFDAWEQHRDKHDSLCVVYPFKKYLLNSEHLPVNFGFGNWHIKSQNLKEFYDMTFTFSILKRESIESCGYHIGSSPYWYNASNTHLDIDTIEDFEIASMIYDSKQKLKAKNNA